MAHAFLAKALEGRARVGSAGSCPSGYVHPKAIEVMAEKGYDISAHKSQHLDAFSADSIDVVVTVCSNARDNCPCMASTLCFHWEFEDPAEVVGTEEVVLNAFRFIRDQIEELFLSRFDQLLPPVKLEA